MKKEKAEGIFTGAEKERTWLFEGQEVLRLHMEYPTVSPQCGHLRRFARYYRGFAGSYERYCDRFLFPEAAEDYRARLAASRPFSPHEAEMTWQSVLQTDGLFSLYIDTRETENGRTENLIRRADTWNLYDGFPLRLGDFFPAELFFRRRLLKQLRRELLLRQSEGLKLREDWKHRLLSCFNAENFYLSEKGLHLYYQMYALAGEEAGIPVFLFPWNREKGPRLGKEFSPAAEAGENA